MRFIYSCDIHGDKEKFEKLIEIARNSGVNNIVLAGDLLPKKADDRESLQREFIHGWYKDFLKRVNEEKIRFISILGNDDVEAIEDEYLEMISEFEYVLDIDKKKADIEGISFIGLSSVLDTPFYRKNRIVVEDGQIMPKQRHSLIEIEKGRRKISSEEWEEYRRKYTPKMREVLNSLPEVTSGNKGIFVFHDPPFGIGLDECKDGDVIGSRDMVEYIRKKQPYMSLHGHVHESSLISGKWNERIGKTICMNCGQSEFGEKTMNLVAVDTERDLYKRGIISVERETKKTVEDIFEERE